MSIILDGTSGINTPDVLKILGKSDEEIDQMFIGASQL